MFMDIMGHNSVYRKFREVSPDAIEKRCTTFRDCKKNECCASLKDGTEVSAGVCRKQPNVGDECGLSALSLQCPCSSGTTCAQSVMHITSSPYRLVCFIQFLHALNAKLYLM